MSVPRSTAIFRRNTIAMVGFMTIGSVMLAMLQNQNRRITGETMRESDYVGDSLGKKRAKLDPSVVDKEIKNMLEDYSTREYEMVRIERPEDQGLDESAPSRPDMRRSAQ